jgi:uncharacterized delta-60 repeat protein
MTSSLKVNGFYRDTAPYVKVGGAWKVSKEAWTKISGSWKQFFLAGGRYDPTISYFLDSGVRALAVQPDQKIIVGGNFNSFEKNEVYYTVKRIARLLPDGSLDLDFKNNTNLGANSNVEVVKIQPDGKILLGGYFETFNGATVKGIVRLNSDGTRDTAFTTNTGTGFNNGVATISLQSDGKIVVGGYFTSFNGSAAPYVLRLNSNGTRDNTFSIGSGASSWVLASAVQSDGKIVLGGTFNSFNGQTIRKLITLNSDGTIVNPFFNFSSSEFVTTLVNYPGEKVLVGGKFSYLGDGIGRGIARLNLNGSLDASFSPGGYGGDDTVESMAVQANGQIIVGGNFEIFNEVNSTAIVRLNPNGSIDQGFSLNIGSGPQSVSEFTGQPVAYGGQVVSLAVQENNKIVIGGLFQTFNSFSSRNIARLGGDLTA